MTGKQVIQVHMQQGIFFALRRLGQNILFYQFRQQSFLKIVNDRTGSVCSRLLCQSIAINEWFLCGYRLISIDLLVFRSSISIDWMPQGQTHLTDL